VHLTGKEYQMLELLSLRKGMTLTKDMFLTSLYGGMDEPEGKIIDVFMCKLRKKLANASGGKDYVETVWGRGHVLREPRYADSRIAYEAVGDIEAVSARSGNPARTQCAGRPALVDACVGAIVP
jgi:DNA-binding winged helix-turn-helix (wHTH) protein